MVYRKVGFRILWKLRYGAKLLFKVNWFDVADIVLENCFILKPVAGMKGVSSVKAVSSIGI